MSIDIQFVQTDIPICEFNQSSIRVYNRSCLKPRYIYLFAIYRVVIASLISEMPRDCCILISLHEIVINYIFANKQCACVLIKK